MKVIAQSPPIELNADGVMLVGKTRVTLDTVVAAFEEGATAEEITYRYPSLKLADVYAVIAFYLNNQQEVAIYLQKRKQQAKEVRQKNESRFDSKAMRDRLLSRKIEKST
ncbi:MAG: DUF433 domain-containing protein [Xenococcaceae cyanobacterium MO_188.B19]|nr:DUF433 domain-containing protein [Xenococcaceae cyanobacterium MO_188.B19]